MNKRGYYILKPHDYKKLSLNVERCLINRFLCGEKSRSHMLGLQNRSYEYKRAEVRKRETAYIRITFQKSNIDINL